MFKPWLALALLVSILLSISGALAVQQQVKTIELPLGFAITAAANTVYTKQLNISMPDGFERGLGLSVRIIGDYATASTSIHAKVRDNKTGTLYDCNPVSVTTPAATNMRRYETIFDCTSILTTTNYKGGIVDVGFMVNKTSTNVQGELRLTYYNNPVGSMILSGTEYSPSDPATMFVQLKDSYGNPVQNGSCYLDVWYPLNGSGVHPYTIQDAPMLQALGDDGMYYYDMTAPSQLGVYMLSAKCSYSYNWRWIYPEDELVYYPVRTVISGTYIGNSQSLVSRSDAIYERCTNAAGTPCQATYVFNVSQYGTVTNVTNVNVYYAGQSDVAGKTLTVAYWNGSTYVNAVNTLTYPASGATSTLAGPVDEYLSNTLPVSAIQDQIVTIRLTTNTGLARFYNNWLALALLSSSGTIQDVKGSSEMHIANIANATVGLVNSQVPAYVWNYTVRNLTYPTLNETATAVWNYTVRNLTYPMPNEIAAAVWNYTPDRYLTYERDTTNYTLVQNYVWNATSRNLTYYPPATAEIDYASIWNYTNRNLTYYPPQQDMTNYTLIDYIVNQALDLFLGVQMTLR